MSAAMPRYVSTRGGMAPVAFGDAVMMGLARDGGLLLPERIPDVRPRLADWSRLSYVELAAAVMAPFVDVPESDFRKLVARSYAAFRHPEVAPVVSVADVFVAELYHGPTLAFKDYALQVVGRLFRSVSDSGLCRMVGAAGDSVGGVPHDDVLSLVARQLHGVGADLPRSLFDAAALRRGRVVAADFVCNDDRPPGRWCRPDRTGRYGFCRRDRKSTRLNSSHRT